MLMERRKVGSGYDSASLISCNFFALKEPLQCAILGIRRLNDRVPDLISKGGWRAGPHSLMDKTAVS